MNMIRKFLIVLSSVVLLVPTGAICRPVSDVIPRPAELHYGQGYFKMDAGDILSSGRVRQSIVRAEPESYVLDVTMDSVIIEAGDSEPAGRIPFRSSRNSAGPGVLSSGH